MGGEGLVVPVVANLLFSMVMTSCLEVVFMPLSHSLFTYLSLSLTHEHINTLLVILTDNSNAFC